MELRNNPAIFTEHFRSFIPDFNVVLDEIESIMENDFIYIFKQLQINAVVKTDKRTLPYNHEIVVKLPAESYVQGMLEYKRTYRKIVGRILKDNAIQKIRFYVHTEIYAGSDKYFTFGRSGIKYCFRYYLPT